MIWKFKAVTYVNHLTCAPIKVNCMALMNDFGGLSKCYVSNLGQNIKKCVLNEYWFPNVVHQDPSKKKSDYQVGLGPPRRSQAQF